ncbi:hypothetical protein QR674_06730 [Acinetobacter chinensis]|uniref:Uncharacterized protein n=1 Tax=Acinetobacter chinensis TaxID=2004650 RepID=A0ABU3WE23_9GAMM|nr:hypothetical protein [Acinetobacter chinensis]MDV2468674.1 hypothetical protein [Acinetobacter chinensis]
MSNQPSGNGLTTATLYLSMPEGNIPQAFFISGNWIVQKVDEISAEVHLD